MKCKKETIKRLGMEVETYYPYEGYSKELLLRYKEGHDRWLAPVFMEAFQFRFFLKYSNYIVVLVPTSSDTLVERGFQPNYEMIKPYHKRVVKDAFLKDTGYKQSLRSGEARIDVKNAIVRNKNIELESKNILLFDDIITTGNSLKACYDILSLEVDSILLVSIFA